MKNRLNHRQLKREIGVFSATAVVVAKLIGTGIFTTSGLISEELGDPRTMILCGFVGGLFALCGALCYGELGARFPEAGGDYGRHPGARRSAEFVARKGEPYTFGIR